MGLALLATRSVNDWKRDDNGKLESVTGSVAPGAVLLAAGAVAAGVGVWRFVRGDAETQDSPSKVNVGIVPPGPGFPSMVFSDLVQLSGQASKDLSTSSVSC